MSKILNKINKKIEKSEKVDVKKWLESEMKTGTLVLQDFMSILKKNAKFEWVVDILINLSTEQGDTLLHLAVSEKKFKAVKILLDKGANPLIANNKGNLPSDIADDKYKTNKTDRNLNKIIKIFKSILYEARLRPGKTALCGYVFQTRLLMLCVLYANENDLPFRLFTECSAAEDFDDIVIETTESGIKVYRFIQAKHRTNTHETKITSSDLFQLKIGGKNHFSIPKYFISFSNIFSKNLFDLKPNMHEKKDFILVTNTDFSEKDLSEIDIYTENEKLLDGLLFIPNEAKKYTFCVAEQNLKERVREELTKNINSTVNEILPVMTTGIDSMIERDFGEFLKRFCFITNYPNEKKLENHMMEKLNKFTKKYNIGLKSDLVSAYFQREMFYFLYRGNKHKAIIYTDESLKTFIEKLRGLAGKDK